MLLANPSHPVPAAVPHASAHRAAALWSIAQFALFGGTVAVLSTAIGWPGILRAPAATALETIHANATATAVGYSLYLLASVALIALALALGRLLRQQHPGRAPLVDLLTVLGVCTGLLKTLGIVRWLSVMPELAARHASGGAADGLRPAIELVYASLNAYAGAVGELLGTQLFAGLWMAGVGALLWRSGWRLTGALGMATAALLLLSLLRLFFEGPGVLNALAGPLGLGWYLVLGTAAWRRQAAGRTSDRG